MPDTSPAGKAPATDARFLDSFFLGPKSEHRQFLQETVKLVLDDYVFWRRNYHPKDPPAISYQSVESAPAREFRERFMQELFTLVSDLKLDVPFFSPRYMAHMVSETTLPALVAYFATLLYNPNNVSSEASPVTIGFELAVGSHFAELFGFDPSASFGHLTSGGTVANYESLWFAKAAKFLPVAMAMTAKETRVPAAEALFADDVWKLLNVPLAEQHDLYETFFRAMATDGHDMPAALKRHSPSWIGDWGFLERAREIFGEAWAEPVVMVPRTAHYSWSRAASVFGIGKRNFWPIDVDEHFCIRPQSLRNHLIRARDERRPVLQVVAVVGTTEYGTVDPIREIVEVRDEIAASGLYAPIHVDAAFGGYFAAMFRPGHRPAPAFVPGPQIRDAFDAIAACESVTVDPHKAGFTPYGAGAVVIRHGFLKDVVAESAPYALDSTDTTTAGGVAMPQIGKFILEGSKPGAAAASVWFTHRMIPLTTDGYGALLAELCRITNDVHAFLAEHLEADHGEQSFAADLVPLFAPQLNILCVAAVPKSATRLSQANRLTKHLAERFGVRNVSSIQSYDYLVSHTAFSAELPAARRAARIAELDADEPVVDVLRLVFLNRWIEGKQHDGTPYLDGFYAALHTECRQFLAVHPAE